MTADPRIPLLHRGAAGIARYDRSGNVAVPPAGTAAAILAVDTHGFILLFLTLL